MAEVSAEEIRPAAEFEADFPHLEEVLRGEFDSSEYEYRAVSIFDSWLGPERIGELDCSAHEYSERCRLLDRFNLALLDRTRTLRVGYRGTDSQPSLEVAGFGSLDEARSHVRQATAGTPGDRFFQVLLPDWQAVYLEDWEFTNVFYLRDPKRIADVQELAAATGLHVLEKSW